MLNDLDIGLLGSADRFERMCHRLISQEYGQARLLGGPWDGGRDVVVLIGENASTEAAWQCKFTKVLNSSASKRSIQRSMDSFEDWCRNDDVRRGRSRMRRWTLCVPVDPSGRFSDWFEEISAKRSFKTSIWGRTQLLELLGRHPSTFEAFFYRSYAELAAAFATDELELLGLTLADGCEWTQSDEVVMCGPSGFQVVRV